MNDPYNLYTKFRDEDAEENKAPQINNKGDLSSREPFLFKLNTQGPPAQGAFSEGQSPLRLNFLGGPGNTRGVLDHFIADQAQRVADRLEEEEEGGYESEEEAKQVSKRLYKESAATSKFSPRKITNRETLSLKNAGKSREMPIDASKGRTGKLDKMFTQIQVEMVPTNQRRMSVQRDQSTTNKDGVPKRTNMGQADEEMEQKNILNIAEEEEREKAQAGQDKVREAVLKRKRYRYFIYLVYCLIFISFWVLLQTFQMINNTFVVNQTKGFSLMLENCTLAILDKKDNFMSPVHIKYQVANSIIPGSQTEVVLDEISDPQVLNITNDKNMDYCLVELFVQPETALGSLDINCLNCNIIQDTSSQLVIENGLNIGGTVVYANFRNIKVGSLSFEAISGYLQLNHIESLSSANTITMGQEGDIVIQSTQDFRLEAQSKSQAFCLGGPTVNLIDTSNCAEPTQNSTEETPPCHITYDLCSSSACAVPATQFTVNSNVGNIYANLLPSVGGVLPVNGTSIAQSDIYKSGIGLSPKADKDISAFDDLVADTSKNDPFIVFDVGNFQSRSSKSTRWIVSSIPSYSLLKPWWIGTFSATVLNSYTEKTQGFLLPGFCPFIPEFTTQQLLEVQNLIASKIKTQNTLITFVHDEYAPLPPTDSRPSSGVSELITQGNPYDNWFSLSESPDGTIVLHDNNYKEKPEIPAAVFVSLVIAAYVSYLALGIFFFGMNSAYKKLAAFASHLASYSKLEKIQVEKFHESSTENNRTERTFLDSGSNFFEILKHAPSPSAFLDYLVLILYRRMSSSVERFYFLIFKEIDTSLDHYLDPSANMIKGTDAKVLYEKFCFIGNINEEKLTDPQNLKILAGYGFEIATLDEQKMEVYTKINIKNYEPFTLNLPEDQKNVDSLDLYMKENVEITQFPEDQVEIATFAKLYYDFCDYNRLTSVKISPSLLKEKYDINADTVPQQFITRIQDQEAIYIPETDEMNELIPQKKSFFKRIFQRKANPNKTYIIDPTKIINYFNLSLGITMDPETTEMATVGRLLFKGWRAWDALTVLLHFVMGFCLVAPLVAYVVFCESEYRQWSIKDPSSLLTFTDFVYKPGQIIFNLYSTFSWNLGIVLLSNIFLATTCFDHLLYYAVMEFPQDRSFKKIETQKKEGYWQIKCRQLEWFLVAMSLSFSLAYVGLLLTWLLLGAFINPNAFLPFASAAATFITFIVTKYNYFKNLINQGSQAIMAYVEQLFGNFINNVASKIMTGIEEKVPGLTEVKSTAAGTNNAENAAADNQDAAQNEEDPNAQAAADVFVPQGATDQATGAATNGEDLKQKAINKIKEECQKREIPSNIADLVIAVSTGDGSQLKYLVQDILASSHRELSLPSEGANILSELLFPQGLSQEETVMFITTKCIKLIFEIGHLDNVPGLTPETFLKMFSVFQNLEEGKYELLAQSMEDFFLMEKNPTNQQFKLLMPILKILTALVSEKHNSWSSKNSCLHLLNAAVYLVPHLTTEDVGDDPLCSFIDFLPLFLTHNEVPYDLDKQVRLESYSAIYTKIAEFCQFIGFDKKTAKDSSLNIKFIPHLIQFSLDFMKQDVYIIPQEVIKGLEREFQAQIPNTSNFLSFWLKLTHFAFNKPSLDNFRHFLKGFKVSPDLIEFLEILMCYSSNDFKPYPGARPIEKNFYFIKIAESLKATPQELAGLIDLLYQKKDRKRIKAFLQAILSRTNANPEKVEALRALTNLFFTTDESLLIKVLKDLFLGDELFLLVGKNLLDPKFIPASEFESLGVDKDLIAEKNTAGASIETLNYWKSEVRKRIAQNVKTLQNDATGFNRLAALKVQRANLIKLYLSDWDTMTYSKRTITSIIEVLDTSQNRLKGILLERDQGMLYNGVDVLAIATGARILTLEEGIRYDNISKEGEAYINTLAEALSINPQGLKTFIQMFVVRDENAILEGFFSFFEEDREHEDDIKRILSQGFSYLQSLRKQIRFVQYEVPESITVLGQTEQMLPNYFFERMLLTDSQLATETHAGAFCETLFYLCEKLKVPQTAHDALRKECCTYALFHKGIVSRREVRSMFGVNNEVILDLLDLLAEPNPDKKKSFLTKLFLKDDHPTKVAIALQGLLTDRDFTIKHHPSIVSPTVPKEESLKTYLSRVLNISSEIFDLFDLTFEQEAPKFLTKSLPIVRRISKTPLVNVSLLENLFLLSLGEHFNPNSLAQKLVVEPEVIELFVTLIRLSKKSTRRREMTELPNLLLVNKALSTLNIKPEELISFIKLIFSIFESDESLMEIITNLKLKRSGSLSGAKDYINIELLKGFTLLNEPLEQLDAYQNHQALMAEREQLTPFFSYLNLSSRDNAFIITSLAEGNFLVIKSFKHDLNWIFPIHDALAEKMLMNLTMGLSGLLNSSVEMTLDFNREIEDFIETIEKKDFAHDRRSEERGCPNNSLAYAAFCASQILNISPLWIQAFLLDEKSFTTISNNIPDLKDEFLLGMVLQFIFKTDTIGDVLGLYEWTSNSLDFYEKTTQRPAPRNNATAFREKSNSLNKYFENMMSFDYYEVKDWANSLGLLDKKRWKDIFEDQKIYNARVNQSLLFLITHTESFLGQDVTKLVGIERNAFKNPNEFLESLRGMLKQSYSDRDLEESSVIGKMIRQSLVKAYEMISQITEDENNNVKDFALTDLSILGTISFLRQASTIPPERKIYNLHQILMNIERKFFLDDVLFKMSKFKMMKLLGIPLNILGHNLHEQYLPPSLFDFRYAKELDAAQTKELRTQVKVRQCERILFSRGKPSSTKTMTTQNIFSFQSQRSDPKDTDYLDDNETFVVADLGMITGTYKQVIFWLDSLLEFRNWDDVLLLMLFNELYVIDLNEESLEQLEDVVDQDSLAKCKTENPKIYNSKELVESASMEDGDNQLRSPTHTMIDPKTGLINSMLRMKAQLFEQTLVDPNVGLLQSMIRGDNSAFLKEGHILAQADPEKKVAKIYMALIGLQTLRQKKVKNEALLKDYLAILAEWFESDILKVQELLSFIITGKPIFPLVVSTFEMEEDVVDFLLINVLEHAKHIQDDSGAEEKRSMQEIISKKLNIPKKDLKAFTMIRNIYQFKKQEGWIQFLRLLPPYNGIADERYEASRFMLENIIQMINFPKLRRQALQGDNRTVLESMKRLYLLDPMSKIFNELILGIYSFNQQERSQIERQYNAIQLLFQLEFAQIFREISTSPKNPNIDSGSQKSGNVLDIVLEEFGIKPDDPAVRRDVKFFKLFLTLGQGSLKELLVGTGLKPEMLINGIVEDLMDLNFFTSLKQYQVIRRKVCELLVLTLIWDTQSLLKVLAKNEMTYEAYLLYSVYGCFNLNKLQDVSAETTQELQTNFITLLLATVTNFTSVAASSKFREKDQNVEVLKRCYDQMNYVLQTRGALDQKVDILFETLSRQEPKTFDSFIDASFAKYELRPQKQEDMLSRKNLSYVLTDVVLSFCDLTIINKLLNTFISDQGTWLRLQKLLFMIFKIREFYNKGEDSDYPAFERQVMRLLNEVKVRHQGDKEPFPALLEMLPIIMRMYLLFQKDGEFSDNIKSKICFNIKNVMSHMPNQLQKDFVSDMVAIITATDINKFGTTAYSRVKQSYELPQRMQILFNWIKLTFFPTIDSEEAFSVWFLQSYNLVKILKTDFMLGFKDAQKHREATEDIVSILQNLQVCSEPLTQALTSVLDSDLVGFEEKGALVAPALGMPSEFSQKIYYLKEVQNYMSSEKFNVQNQAADQVENKDQAVNINSETWAVMTQKIKDGTASSKDLFNLVDQEGDRSGSISESEFLTLTTRLGLKLSSHRVKEIFAKVKGERVNQLTSQDLTVDEFEKALNYLQEKNLEQALLLLGITPEILTGVLIRLTILLILIFTFIFLGIKAFAIGGTFGSIINSLFPAAGGLALGKEDSSGQNKLQEDQVQKATDTGFDITVSGEL